MKEIFFCKVGVSVEKFDSQIVNRSADNSSFRQIKKERRKKETPSKRKEEKIKQTFSTNNSYLSCKWD